MTQHEKDKIWDFIPQRPPFVFVDTLLSVDEEKTVSSYTVAEESLMLEGDYLSEGGLVENIAQTAAAGVGYDCLTNNKPVVPGFIGAVKKLQVFDLPAVSETLTTTVAVVTKVMHATIIKGEVRVGETLLALCEMNIFLQES